MGPKASNRGKRRAPQGGGRFDRNKRWKGDSCKTKAELHSPKRKYALVFGYCGLGHHGMQRQVPGSITAHLPTIEGVLESALLASGGLTKDQLDEYQKLQWARVGRTDAGVHAVCQVVTCKISLGPLVLAEPVENGENASEMPDVKTEGCDGEDEQSTDVVAEAVTESADPSQASTHPSVAEVSTTNTKDSALQTEPVNDEDADSETIQRSRELAYIDKIRAHLPEGFELFELTRVPNNYDARFNCSLRQYEYYLPLKVFQKVQVYDNHEALLKFFGTYGAGKLEIIANSEPSDSESPASKPSTRFSLLTFEEKKELLSIVQDEENITTAWDLMKGRAGEFCARYRHEICWIRRLFSTLSHSEREACWLEYHGSLPADTTQIPYAPPELLSIRQPQEPFVLTDPEERRVFLDKVNRILARYEGHHSWFNFTSKMQSTDGSIRRFMKSVTAHFVELDHIKEPLLVIRLHGSSFVLNQIRKMASILLEIMIGTAPLAANAFLTQPPVEPKKHVHTAPGELLMLERACMELESRSTKEPIERMKFYDEYEQLHPHGPKMQALLARGVYEPPAKVKPATNPLSDVVKEESIADETPQGESLYEWHEANTSTPVNWWDVPVWFRMLKFKFFSLLPRALAACEESQVFAKYVADLNWHPFFAENYPTPSPNDYFKDIDKVIKGKPKQDDDVTEDQEA